MSSPVTVALHLEDRDPSENLMTTMEHFPSYKSSTAPDFIFSSSVYGFPKALKLDRCLEALSISR